MPLPVPRPPGPLMLLLVSVLAISACSGESAAQGNGAQDQTMAVRTHTAAATTIDVTREYPARIQGVREVEVRARVQGILEERLYREGEQVSAGTSLFRIDPAPFEVALERARAQEAVAQAELDEAERDWRRVSRLYEDNAVSERDRDRAKSALDLARANLRSARASVAEAELNLKYTGVESPIDGITSLEVLPEGSLVNHGTLLTTLVQLDPAHIHFSLPERDSALRRQHLANHTDDNHLMEVELILADGASYPEKGKVDFSASTIDQRTSSQAMRAVFANPGQQLVPGQFVRIRMSVGTLKDVITVPERAIGHEAGGPRVFVVDQEGKARSRSITLGPETEGPAVVLDGLEPGDLVVVEGLVGMRDGADVKVLDDRGDRRDQS